MQAEEWKMCIDTGLLFSENHVFFTDSYILVWVPVVQFLHGMALWRGGGGKKEASHKHK